MRARGLLLALMLIASACSTPPASEQAGSAPSDNTRDEAVEEIVPGGSTSFEDDDSATAASDDSTNSDQGSTSRQMIESSDTGASSGVDSEDVPEGVAFEDPQTSADDGTADAADAAESTATTVAAAPLSEFDRLVSGLIDFVEIERGYSFEERPTIELLGEDEFRAAWTSLIADDVAENSADYLNYTDIYRAMGIIDGDRTLEEIWQRFGDAGVLGFYNQETGGITLRSGEVNAFTETVLVHELVHALEDQIFDLDRPEYDDASTELEWTFSALIEGSARRIESNYRATFSSEKLAEETEARRAIPRPVSLSEFTNSFLELQFGRYTYGENFATTLWADGKQSLDAAFTAPPETSEAVLDPQAHLAGDETDGVSAPPADGEIFESGVWGQAGWAAILTDLNSQAAALAIADGWNGDAFVAWREGGQTCVRMHLAGDSPAELDVYAAALEDWASTASGREIFYPTADLIRVTSCG